LGFPLNAEPVNSETTDSATAVTPEQIAVQRKEIARAKAKLKKAKATVQAEEKALRKKIARLKKTDKITENMLKKAAEAAQTANQNLKTVREKRQTLQTEQDKKKASLAKREAQLKELTESPPAELTAAQRRKEILTIKKEVALFKKAVELVRQHLGIITVQIQENVKQSIVAIEWHAELQTVQYQHHIQEREQEIVKSNAALERFKKALITQKEELPNKIEALKNTEETVDSLKEKLEQARSEKRNTDVDITSINSDRLNVENTLNEQSESLKKQEDNLELLRNTPVKPEYAPLSDKKIAVSEKHIELQNKKRELEQKHLDILKERLDQANTRLTLSTKWYDELQPVLYNSQKQELEKRIQREKQKHLDKAANLRQKLDLIPILEKNAAQQRYLLNIQIREANELAERASRRLKNQHFENRLQQWQKTAEQNQKETTAITQKQLDNEKAIIAELEEMIQYLQESQSLLQKKIAEFNQQQLYVKEQRKTLSGKALDNTIALQALTKLSNTLQQELDNVPILLTKSQELFVYSKKVYQENMRRALLRHRTLPANTVELWSLVKEIGTIPTLIMQQLQLTGRGFMQTFQQTSFSRWIVISIATLIWLILAIGINIWGSRILKSTTGSHKAPLRLAENTMLGLRLWDKNTLIIVIVGVFLLLLGLTQPNSLTVTVTLYLLLIGLGAKLLIDFFGLLLFSPNLLLFSSNLKSQDTIKLGRRIQFVIIVLALLAIVTVLVHLEHEGQVGLSLRAQDFVDTLFMVMLVLIIPPLVRARQLMLTLTQGRNRNVTGLITLLLAGSVLVVSLLGVIGYITLGWTIANYLSVFLLVLTGWLIAGGILKDLMQLWKNAVSKQGLYDSLWTEDIIPLAQNLLGFALLGLAVMLILWLTGWYSNIAITEGFKQVVDYPLMTIENGKDITVLSVFLSFLIVWVVFWFGAWSRRISYRWIFMNLTDSGVRHSLSIFIQYVVILIGLLIALKTMGIDPTALTVFAGAVGVGLGFGLQNIASNFISGILLLVERPLRVGDYVEIDSPHGTEVKYDGTVTHIGIRSLTLERRNAKKIIVPNSTIISNPFINQGGSTGEEDSTEEESRAVRNTLNIGISYDSDLNLARRVIQDILEEVPEVLSVPPFQVYLSEFTDFKVDFRIDYFVNMLDIDSLEVKSKVLYSIWTRFKVAGITIAHSPVLVKTVSDSR
jgi:potassium efflux system protein